MCKRSFSRLPSSQEPKRADGARGLCQNRLASLVVDKRLRQIKDENHRLLLRRLQHGHVVGSAVRTASGFIGHAPARQARLARDAICAGDRAAHPVQKSAA